MGLRSSFQQAFRLSFAVFACITIGGSHSQAGEVNPTLHQIQLAGRTFAAVESVLGCIGWTTNTTNDPHPNETLETGFHAIAWTQWSLFGAPMFAYIVTKPIVDEVFANAEKGDFDISHSAAYNTYVEYAEKEAGPCLEARRGYIRAIADELQFRVTPVSTTVEASR